jgi:pimeloyl-ACP methyl ester carboxylesterase
MPGLLVRRNIGPLRNFAPTRYWRPRERPDVVLLQGFGTGPLTVHPLAKALTRRGLACCVPRLGGLLGYLQTEPVATAGRRLAEYLRALGPGRRPWLIGHSVGGIIARDAVQRAGAAGCVAGVVTVGAPHQGTPAAVLGWMLGLGLVSRSPRQMAPGARTLRRLNGMPWPDGMPLISVLSPQDLLCKPRSGRIPFADGAAIRNVLFEGLGHTEMLDDSTVHDAIAGWITGA